MNAGDIKKILVIRFRRIGDAVLSTTLCDSLKRSFPNAEVHYVLNENIAPLFRGHPAIDRIITLDKEEQRKAPKFISKVRRTVREEHYDIIIDIRSTIQTSLFAVLSPRSKYKIAFRKPYNYFGFTDRVKYSSDGKDVLWRTLKLLDPLEKDFKIERTNDFRLYPDEREIRDFRAYMVGKGIDFSKPVVLCGIAAREPDKAWDIKRTAEVMRNMISKYDMQLVFNYADEVEKTAVMELQDILGSPAEVFTNIEAGNLRDLMSMLALTSFYYGNEGGTRHIAQAIGIPSYAIFSPKASKKMWLPGESDRYRGIDYRDMPGYDPSKEESMSYREKYDLIDAATVWQGVDDQLYQMFPESIRGN